MSSIILGLSYTMTKSIGGGFIVFGFVAFYGLALFLKGVSGDTLDWLGHSVAPRWLYILSGIVLQIPLIAFAVFIYCASHAAQ